MKKIAILAVADKPNGGTFQYTCKIIETLKKNNSFEFVIFTNLNNYNYESFGLTIIKKDFSKKRWLLVILSFLLGLKRNKYFDNFNHIIAPIYSPFLLTTKVPYTFTLHDLQEYYYPNFFTKFELIWRKFINKSLVDNSKHILCESDYVKNDIINFFKTEKEKIKVIPAPAKLINTQIFINEIDVLKKYFLIDNDFLIYPAQFWKHKNHNKLIEAFKIVSKNYPKLKLVFTGRKRFEYNNILEKVHKLNLDESIIFTDYLEEDELYILLKKSILLILPTLFESISIPIFEAFQLGTVVCSSNVVSLPQQVLDAGLLFNPLLEKDIADKIKQILENSTLRENLIRNGYKRLEYYSDSNFQSNFNDFLNNI